jgi:uncharacterized Zn-finger protein
MAHKTDASNEALETASAQQCYEVHRADLPLSCPMPDQKLWNAHPRVYLPIAETGTALCPYCSARYILVD